MTTATKKITGAAMTKTAIALAAGLAFAACGGTSGFGLSAGDNDPAKLAEAFASLQAPSPGPVNKLGKPMVFLAARGTPKQLVAYDLEGKAELWRVDSEVSSKVIVGRDFVAYKQGEKQFVARDVATGGQLWSMAIDGSFVGAASDASRVFITTKNSSRKWSLKALDGKTGSSLWDVSAPGVLGTPAARGGLVFSPYMKQWLTIIDANNGKVMTRIRGIDEEISFVRTTPSEVYFGSKSGVFLLDEKAASGKRAQSTYGVAALPKQFEKVHYHWDAFDPIQAGYSAYDRNRILWNAASSADGFAFQNDMVTVQTYRFFFSFNAKTGDLQWAYNHPRVDIIASSNVGSSIGIASMAGDLGALDPITGQRIYQAKIPGQFIGGTFDADGWSPKETVGENSSTAAALAGIARDRDARFNAVKKYAVIALSQLKGADVAKDLLALIQNEKTPPYLLQTAGDVLVARKDPTGLVHLVAALQLQSDYVAGTKARSVGVVARSIAALDPEGIDPKLRGEAIDSLLAHLNSPQTAAADLIHLVMAIGNFAQPSGPAMETLNSFLLVYRADPSFATQTESMTAIIDLLLSKGAAKERATVSFVAEDPVTQSSIADYARKALVSRPEKIPAKEVPAKDAASGKGAAMKANSKAKAAPTKKK